MQIPDWARACGAPLCTAAMRTRPEDFRVTEDLDFEFSDDGEHDYLWIEKRDANTEWVARQLARFAGVAPKEVGYAGLKDRHAVTRQWFSVPRWEAPDWSGLELEGVQLLQQRRHRRKLRRGAHRANAFRIVLRGAALGQLGEALPERLQQVAAGGVPNYFGEQRFGRDGANLQLVESWVGGARLPRHKRSLAISTLRSFEFNTRLERRVRDGSWNRLLPGDTVNLDGSGSVFTAATIDADLERRCVDMDVHPAGELVGCGSQDLRPDWLAALEKGRVEPGSRSLRLRVTGLEHALDGDMLELSFRLGRGAFATSVLREVLAW